MQISPYITLSGWVIAIGMASWKVGETFFSRPKVAIDVSQWENSGTNWVSLTVANLRNPVNLIRAGIEYDNGNQHDFTAYLAEITPRWVYKMQPRVMHLSASVLKKLVADQNEDGKAVSFYFADEKAHMYRTRLPESVQKLIYEKPMTPQAGQQPTAVKTAEQATPQTTPKEEITRWKSFANALLITMPLLFTGMAIFNDKTTYFFLSGSFALIGTLAVVLWHSWESNWHFGKGRLPALLVIADYCFALQVIFLVFQLAAQVWQFKVS
jgi:hypothetical protein